MPSITTQAIVLRHADYREHDRMLTLLSPALGRVEALCRGCKRPQSPLLSASEWFTLGEYVLFTGKSRMTVSSCHVTETFYPLRSDYDRLRLATYLLSVAEAAAQPNERAVELFTLLARSLSRLAYTDRDTRAVAAAFLLHFSAIQPLLPRQALWMRDVLQRGIDKTDLPDQDAPGPLLSAYVEARLEKKLRSAGLWS